MSGHTKGPWRVNHNIGRKSELGITADAAPCVIACMSNVKAWPLEAQANAALIAAAPDMLEALRHLVNTHTGAAWQTAEAQREAWLEAAAAIRRATGTNS